MKNLVIVESPAKAKTIKKYLGSDFEVLASYGHVRDLIPKQGAVDPQKNFAMKYKRIEKNEKHVNAIVSALKKAEKLYLAPDPDREGEAISWHIYEILKEEKALKNKEVFRIVFYEITKNAVNEAILKPRSLATDLIDAQQARRALDYLVGFNLSPLLWKKIRRGLSAGRVQSPALRMIVEREEEIEKFISKEYWTIEADLLSQEQTLNAKLIQFNSQKLEQFSISTAEHATSINETLIEAAKGYLVVKEVKRKKRKRNPSAPFTTSTLQQEAARKLNFTTQRTMRTAQQLYEGVDVGKGAVGLITYMRTDSVNLAKDAITDIRQLIVDKFGKNKLPESPKIYQTKSKNAQEAHEAIRPTSIFLLPEDVKAYLTSEQYKLYELIWKRTVASQMIHATINTVSVDLLCGESNIFRANGSIIAEPGFIEVYQESFDDRKENDDHPKLLPPLTEGDKVKLITLRNEQHFTEAPPRYSEASLVKALEEYGIGRPSTYASIISTLQQRDYTILELKRFKPTDVGRIVNKFLTQHFTQYVDYDFTAKLEDELDAIARGEKAWVPVMEEFWQPFHQQVDLIEENVQRKDVTQETIDELCPKCEKPLSIRLGKRGRFIGCTGFPECDFTRNMNENNESIPEEPVILEGRLCPDCNSPLHIKKGRYGKFIGCSQYPKCKHMEPLEKPKDTDIVCPQCHEGTLLTRKSRYGKIFYSCSTYPKCNYAIWNEPLKESCPKCDWPILTLKTTKRKGTQKICPQKECGFTENVVES
ncbi:MAG: DNA topoisomerase 1 [Legionellaceae bacterium]